MSDIRPKRPTRGGWAPCEPVPGLDAEVWWRHGLKVLSSLGTMEAPDSSGDLLPTWLVSVSREGTSMPSDADMKRVRRDFDVRQGDEDNHESGTARKLFLVVERARRVDCECKTDETVVTRPDGYRYSVKKPGASP